MCVRDNLCESKLLEEVLYETALSLTPHQQTGHTVTVQWDGEVSGHHHHAPPIRVY